MISVVIDCHIILMFIVWIILSMHACIGYSFFDFEQFGKIKKFESHWKPGENKIIFSSGARFQPIDFLNVTDPNRVFLNPVK